jgi:hypothetical protein
MASSWKSALIWASCALPLGCTSGYSEDAGVELASSQSSLALVALERTEGSDSERARLSASAKVARFRGIDGDGLLKLLGAELRDLESCGMAAALEPGVSAAAQVDLLSVGPITVRLGDARHSLAPRLFPALATTAAGWFYAGGLELSATAGSEELSLSAPGERGQGKFELFGAIPAEVQGLSLSGLPAEAGVTLTRSESIELTWEPEGPGDRIEIELFAGGSALSCAARDDGHFTLSRAQLQLVEADEDASLVVRRVRVLPVEMTSIESAYARLASARTFTLPLR